MILHKTTMDQEFVKQFNAIAEWKKDSSAESSEYSAFFPNAEEGIVTFSSTKGSFTYRLKILRELFAPHDASLPAEAWQNPLLMAIESAISRTYKKNPELTDPLVILALEQLAAKPDAEGTDTLTKAIVTQLTIELSLEDFSRADVRRALNKVLRSVRRHYEVDGRRGYLDFICEHVP